ncbi:hypothetical protein KIPB_013997, partial [Kipferlia bialata]|eukprot:g13997.t1
MTAHTCHSCQTGVREIYTRSSSCPHSHKPRIKVEPEVVFEAWPEPRFDHLAFELDGKMLIVGGIGEWGSRLDYWSFDPATRGWTCLGQAPITADSA